MKEKNAEDHRRFGKLRKSNLRFDKGEDEEEIGKLTDLLTSTNGIFFDAASEKAILCLTSGHS